ncbi:hypothetical protein BGZ96_012172 [Linnemannia gamsii]|uniref:Uncharacterized protein n=1 Tax=Linnemannia gamsii TaxID=64522 RepID=A0ABQ7KC20_9FUNG|nr:hypothetical protein BGZ96_012172 [Linnemannia gamsii]
MTLLAFKEYLRRYTVDVTDVLAASVPTPLEHRSDDDDDDAPSSPIDSETLPKKKMKQGNKCSEDEENEERIYSLQPWVEVRKGLDFISEVMLGRNCRKGK